MPYDVFLSHAGADKPAVERLATSLREARVEPFLDKWHLIPGQPWQEALEEALDQSRTCAVFIGKEIGPWQDKEMRSALETQTQNRSFRVIPVLLPGGRRTGEEKLPRFLRGLTWVDFRAGLDDEDAFRRLLAGIRGEAPGPGSGGGGEAPSPPYRCMAPARESFVARREYEEAIQALLAGGGKERGATVGLTTALQGAGGFGKTALATELCYDPRVREQYPDGILWTTLGEEIDAAGRLARVRDLIRWWTEKDPPAFETVSAASAHLRRELEGRRALLVADDVWRPEDVTPFQGLGAKAALLVTTRDSRTLPGDSMPIHVDAMEVPEAVRLLGAGLPEGTDVDLQGLAKRLGEWPLLLKIVNRQLRDLIQNDDLSLELALKEVDEALDAEGLTAFDHEDLESRDQAVARTVGASLRRLPGEEVGRFEQLAIFPEDKDIPLRVLDKLWGLGSYAAKKLCGRLHDLSLLLRFDRAAGTIRLHDVIRAYLLKKGESHLPEWNRRLLDTFRPANGRWPELPQEESYLWYHLFHHLIEAGQDVICRDLLLDFQYLRSKLGATDINTLLADYSFFAEKEQELRLVRDSLRLSAHVLVREPAQLREQLYGRLFDRQEAVIRALIRASEASCSPWLRPRKESLVRPGGSLMRTIDHPGTPSALAVLPDGRVVSGSVDGALRLWDVESGQVLKVFEGQFGGVHAVALLDNRRVVSVSADGALRMWDVESGQILKVLNGLSGRVYGLAVLDSRRVITGYDKKLRLWDVENGQVLQVFEGHSARVYAVAALDCNRVISGAADGVLRLWDLESGQTLQVLEGGGSSIIIKAVASLDGRRAVSCSFNETTVRVWDMESGMALQTLEGHQAQTLARFDSRRVVSGALDRTLRLWDVESGDVLQIFEGHAGWVTTVAVLDRRRVISGAQDETLRVWNVDVENGLALQELKVHTREVEAVAVLDSRRVLSGAHDGILGVWDVESGQISRVFEGQVITTMAVLDSHRVALGGLNGMFCVWDVESGLALQTLEESSGFRAMAMLDSRRVISGHNDKRLRVWDVESAQELQAFEGHSNVVVAVAVLDSRRFVSGSHDRTVRVWDLEGGPSLQVLEGHSSLVNVLAVLDSRRVISGSRDQTLRVWDVEIGETLQVLEGHSGSVDALAVLDSRRVVSGSFDRTLRVWNVESGEVECLFTLEAPVTAVAVIPGSGVIVAGDDYGRVHFFDVIES